MKLQSNRHKLPLMLSVVAPQESGAEPAPWRMSATAVGRPPSLACFSNGAPVRRPPSLPLPATPACLVGRYGSLTSRRRRHLEVTRNCCSSAHQPTTLVVLAGGL